MTCLYDNNRRFCCWCQQESYSTVLLILRSRGNRWDVQSKTLCLRWNCLVKSPQLHWLCSNVKKQCQSQKLQIKKLLEGCLWGKCLRNVRELWENIFSLEVPVLMLRQSCFKNLNSDISYFFLFIGGGGVGGAVNSTLPTSRRAVLSMPYFCL